MFTPGQIEGMPVEIERQFRLLQERVMADVVRRIRINGEITRAADWQLYRATELGVSSQYLQQEIADALDMSFKGVDGLYDDVIAKGYAWDERLYKAVGADFIPYNKNTGLQQLINAISKNTKQELVNITQSLGFAKRTQGKLVFTPLSMYYQQTLDKAALDISTGVFDYNTVLKRTVGEMTNSGLRSVDYSTGRSNRIDTAVRRAVMTGVSQVTGHISEQNAEALGTDYFEVSWHATARPSHQEWQGKVFSKKDLETVCGLGAVDGLKGANCYHEYYPFIPGVSKRQYTDEQLNAMNAVENAPMEYMGTQYTKYEATQEQREMERLMRKQRQDIDLLKKGGADDKTIGAARARYRNTMHSYSDFSKKMGLPQERERIYVDGLGRV